MTLTSYIKQQARLCFKLYTEIQYVYIYIHISPMNLQEPLDSSQFIAVCGVYDATEVFSITKALQDFKLGLLQGFAFLWLARNEEIAPYSSPYMTHDSNLHFSCPFLHSRLTKGKFGHVPVAWILGPLGTPQPKIVFRLLIHAPAGFWFWV